VRLPETALRGELAQSDAERDDWSVARQDDVPPGTRPPSLRIDRSLTRSLRRYSEDPLRWVGEAAEMGPIVGIKFGHVTPTYLVNDPEIARSILITEAKDWKRPLVTIAPIRLAIGENLFTQSERDWSLLQPSLAPDFRKRALEPRLTQMEALIDEEVATLPYDEDIDFDQAMGRIALMVATWVLFGERLERDRADELVSHQRAAVSWLDERIKSRRAFLPVALGREAREMRQHRAVTLAYANEIVEARRGSAPRGDVLDAFLAARPGGRTLSPAELSFHVAGLFGAGNETTAAALSWAVVYGAAQSGEWAQLREDPSTAPNFAAETLRLSPPAWGIPRSPAGVRGTEIIAGPFRVRVWPHQMVAINVFGMNRDERVWPNASTFDPGRQRQLSRLQERALIPFGLGVRGCIGQQIALSELDAVLGTLSRHGDVEVDGSPIGHPTFSLRVRGGLRARFRRPRPKGHADSLDECSNPTPSDR
jgi:cytochrome P450